MNEQEYQKEAYQKVAYQNAQNAQNKQTTNAIQDDLETQLRMFSASVADGVVHGFDGRSAEFSERAKGVGSAFVKAVEREFTSAPKKQWSYRRVQSPSAALEKANSNRYGVGMLQSVFGAMFGLTMLVAGVVCFFVSAITPPDATMVLRVTAVPLMILGAPLSWMFFCGQDNLKITKRVRRYISVVGESASISLAQLTEATGYSMGNIKKDVRKIMEKDWCPLWYDERQEVLHFSLESYREAKAKESVENTIYAAQNTQADQANTNQLLAGIAGFVDVLGKQKQLMAEADAVEELTKMQETCRDIHDWIQTHPEVAPKMRRFTSYYMPTTLKLLYSYNDVQGQQGENAQTIRQDIGRFLHTLNIAFDNLHDSLLSSASLDVSSEIAALQGMLAQDGLSQNDAFGTTDPLSL